MIEIERRAQLGDKKKEVFEFLETNAQLLSKIKQMSIFIEFNHDALGSLENLRNSISIAIKKNVETGNTSLSVKLKKGSVESTSRKESSFVSGLEDIEGIFEFMRIFGIDEGCPRYYKRTDYQYNEYTISIKEDGLVPDHIEVEYAEDGSSLDSVQIKSLEETIDSFLVNELGLQLWNGESYKSSMQKMLEENPPIPFDKIDLSIFS